MGKTIALWEIQIRSVGKVQSSPTWEQTRHSRKIQSNVILIRKNLWKILDLSKCRVKEKRHLTSCYSSKRNPEPYLRQWGKGLGDNSSYSLYDKEEPDSGIWGAHVIVNAEILHHSTKYSSADCNVECFLHMAKIIAQRTTYISNKILGSSRSNCVHESRAPRWGRILLPFNFITFGSTCRQQIFESSVTKRVYKNHFHPHTVSTLGDKQKFGCISENLQKD